MPEEKTLFGGFMDAAGGKMLSRLVPRQPLLPVSFLPEFSAGQLTLPQAAVFTGSAQEQFPALRPGTGGRRSGVREALAEHQSLGLMSVVRARPSST